MGKRPNGRSYNSRDIILRSMGFRSYKEYLESELWFKIRRKAFSINGSMCFLCGQRAQQIHHERYQLPDLAGKRFSYLKPICVPCHKAVEFNVNGRKRSLSGARKAARKIKKTELEIMLGL